MSLTRYQQKQQRENLRTRGWIVCLLYEARPRPLDMAELSADLDSVNFGCGRRTLANHVDYLRSLKLVRVFQRGVAEEVSEPEQAILIQKYCGVEDDSEMNFTLCVRLSAKGTDFQDGLLKVEGVERMR